MLVFNPITFEYNFLKYDNTAFTIYKHLTLNDLPFDLANMGPDQITQNGKIGDNCSFLAISNFVFSLTDTSFTAVNINFPLSINSFSNSMTYLYNQNTIMKYAPSMNQYVPIYYLYRTPMNFRFYNFDNRLICLYFDAQQVNSTIYYTL